MPVLREFSASETGGVPVKVWTDQIEEGAAQQLRALAALPSVVHHVAAMPDVHVGHGATVGSVFATRDVLLPTAVGVDLGCGMLAQPFDLRAVDLSLSFLRELHEAVKATIPTGFAEHRQPQAWEGFADETRYTPAVRPIVREKGPAQLGSLGGGNHFIELSREADAERTEARVWLLLHSGSRGAGNLIASHHIAVARDLAARRGLDAPRDLPPLPLDTPEGQAYLRDMRWGQDYAFENRQRMLGAFIGVFARLLRKRLRLDLACDPAACINIHHNYADREAVYGEALLVHRKGATHAGAGVLGIIPGSMATGSYIVRGLGNPESFNSCSHGAGRVMSRSAAVRSITLDAFARKMTGIVAETGREYLDEAPQAYKDLDTVIAYQSDLVVPVRRLLPLMNVKGAGKGKKYVASEGDADGSATRTRHDRTRDKGDAVQRRKLAQRGRR